MTTSRRGFLAAMLAAAAAPAIVKAESLMLINPRQGLIVPKTKLEIVWAGDYISQGLDMDNHTSDVYQLDCLYEGEIGQIDGVRFVSAPMTRETPLARFLRMDGKARAEAFDRAGRSWKRVPTYV